MDLHYKQEVTVGGLVLLGVVLFLGGTMWLGGRRMPGAASVKVSFSDAMTLKRGSPVKVSGVSLGTVEGIDYQSYGKVLVRLNLDKRALPRKDASATLATVGLVADAVVNFNPGTAAEPLPPDAVIEGTIERGIMDMGSELGGKAGRLMDGVNQVQFKQLSEDLSRTLQSFQRLSATYSDTRGGPVAQLTSTMESLQRVSARIDSVLAAAQLDRSLRTADSMMASVNRLTTDAQATARQLDELLGRVNRGEGTLGKFASDTAFYDNARKLMQSLQEFVDDLKKHPGKLGITVKVF
jgi:phospholipid/cholesterol/gamma-HCH transport system substrate-binding protein